MPKPEAMMKQPELVAGLRFADVDGGLRGGAGEGRSADREGPDLGIVGAFGRAY